MTQHKEIVSPLADARPYEPSRTPHEVPKTAGERIHNEITYRGVDWIANTICAVGFSFWAARTKMGQTRYSAKLVDGLESLASPIAKDAEDAHALAKKAADFVNIAVGGAVIIPPVMLLDAHKRGIAEWFDRRIHGDTWVDQNEQFAIRYQAIENRPQKDFATGMAARFGVLIPMLYAHTKFNPQMNKIMYQPLASATKWGAERLAIQPKGMMSKKQPDANGSMVSDWDWLHTTLGMDLGLTFIYSFAHEWAYKGLTNMVHGSKTSQVPASPAPTIRTDEADTPMPLKQPSEKVVMRHG